MPTEKEKALIATIKEEIVLTMKAMQPEMEAAVGAKIESTVNGKINALRSVVDAHVTSAEARWEKQDEFMDLMTPVAQGLVFGSILRKFAVWVSGFGIVGTILWLGIRSYFK